MLRIKRLEEKFGGPGKHMSTMVQRIKAISEVGKDYGKVQEAVFALERFLESRYCRDPNDPLTAEIIRPYMKDEVRQQYRGYIHDHRLKDTAVSILKFLKKMLEIREDDQKHNIYKHRKTKKAKKESKKEKDKTKDKKANYQFFNPPSSEDTESSEDSFANESFYDSSEEEGQFNWQKQDTTCDFCKGLHNIFQCLKFFCELTHGQRRKWVIKEKRCPFCLRAGHKRGDCDRKRFCRFCKGDHNSCLHVEPKKEVTVQADEGSKNKGPLRVKGPKRTPKEKASKTQNNQTEARFDVDESSSESDEANIHSSRQSGKVSQHSISLTTFVACIRDPITGNLAKVNALADSGADHTILSARAARDLGLWEQGKGSNYYVKGHGGSRGCYLAQKFDLELLGPDGKKLRGIRVSSYESPCGDLRLERWGELKNDWEHLRDLPLENPVGDGLVDFVLGSSSLDLMEAVEAARFGPPGGPVAKKTRLGWIVGGRTTHRPEKTEKREGRLNFSLGGQIGEHKKELARLELDYETRLSEQKENCRQVCNQLKEDLKKLWGTNDCCRQALKNAVSPAVESKEDSKARTLFEKSKRTDSEGYEEVGLLWKGKGRPKNNGRQALGIFLGMERRMKSKPGLWEAFCENIADWISKGYARKVGFHEHAKGFFIPTFMVVREDKSTTKFRLIVNGKFEFGGKSINDYLLSGPNVMNKLADVLIRFRYHKYVLTCDISNMFLRVKVPEKDRQYLRFFHRDDDGQIVVIEMNSHAFGLTQSPFVVINTVKEKAERRASDLKRASKAVIRDSIVDDILTGCKTYEGLKSLQEEIIVLYDEIQMKAHKWATNSPTLRGELPIENKEPVNLGKDPDELIDASNSAPSIKCLGIMWHPTEDSLQFFWH